MSKKTTDVLNTSRAFRWGELLSSFTDKKSNAEVQKALCAGTPGNVPYESEMVQTWEYPFLFFKLLIWGVLLIALIFLCNYMFNFGNAILLMVAPFVFPLVILMLIWELNIPRNIPFISAISSMLVGGIMCVLIMSFAAEIITTRDNTLAEFLFSLLAEVCELVVISFLLRKRSRGYGLNGLVIGAAVGAGVAAFTTAESLSYVVAYNGTITGVSRLIIVELLLTIGMDTLWCASIGGALALSKKKESLGIRHFGDSLFIISFISCYLMKFLWNYNLANFFGRFSDSDFMVSLYRILEVYRGKAILLIVIAWAFMLFIARACINQSVEISSSALDQKRKWDAKVAGALGKSLEVVGVSGPYAGQRFEIKNERLSFGRGSSNNVIFGDKTKGISSSHCSIVKNGDNYVLSDAGSSYGTFVGNGRKLAPGESYVLRSGEVFHLASKDNSFSVNIKESKADNVSATQFGHRTNEVDGQEESSFALYALCITMLAAVFLGLYASNYSLDGFGDFAEETVYDGTITGRWESDSSLPIKDIILQASDNLLSSILDVGILKEAYADGITFTEEGSAYMTNNGKIIDYAKFTYEKVDDRTIYLHWDSNISVDGGLSLGIFSASTSSEASADFVMTYTIDADGLHMNFSGYSWNLEKK